MGMKDALPYLGMVGVQFIQVGLIVAIKEATKSGMTKFTFVSYYNALSSLVLLPTSFLIHRYLPLISISTGICVVPFLLYISLPLNT